MSDSKRSPVPLEPDPLEPTRAEEVKADNALTDDETGRVDNAEKDNTEEDGAEEFVLFLDYNFGRKVVATALRAIGIQCEPHLDHFAENAPDTQWLVEVGGRGWFVVTKDEMIGRRTLELDALRLANAGVFVLASNNLTGSQMAATLVAVVPKMKKFVQNHERPFIAKFYKDGRLIPWK